MHGLSAIIRRLIQCGMVMLLTMLPMSCRQAPQGEVTIVCSADTQGWITPCGCTANQSGGLARRATLLKRLPSKSKVLLLDAGGSAIGRSEYQTLRLRFLLKGLNAMGLDAHNIGQSELHFSAAELESLGKELQIHWLSTNLYSADGEFSGQRIVHWEGNGLKVDVVGVIDPKLVISQHWKATDPIKAIAEAFRNSKADVKVVLAYFQEEPLRNLAANLPEVDYVIGGPTGQTIAPSKQGSVTLMSTTNKGKFLCSIGLAKNGKRWSERSAEIVEVVSTLSEDQTQLQNLKDYYAKLASRDFSAKETGIVDVDRLGQESHLFAGSDRCQSCHASDYAIWKSSNHSHAWNVLTAKRVEFDPICQQCHSTGFAQQNGFDRVANSESMFHVGCETCHGPSAEHVSHPKSRTPYQAKDACRRCHDSENSPRFQWDTYWPKIHHDGKPQLPK